MNGVCGTLLSDLPVPLQENGAKQAALELAERICANAIWHAELCAFHGASPAPQLGQPARWQVFGGDFYEGSAGIARALAYFSLLQGHACARNTALGAIRHALRHAQGWSLHSGGLGIALVALELAELLDEPSLEAPALALARASLDAACADAERGLAPLDLMSGLAGSLRGALTLGGRITNLEQTTRVLARHLSEQSRPQAEGHSWALHPPAADNGPHLCGLAHGAAGVALALQHHAAADSARPDAETSNLLADSARRYERLHFDSIACSWADLRESEPATGAHAQLAYPHYWCHGSVGVAHERRAALRQLRIDDPGRGPAAADLCAGLHGVRREARRLLTGPIGVGAGFEINASQCHGLSGMIDLLVETGTTDDLRLASDLARLAREDARGPQGWRCGNPGGEPCPGLMTGWAGLLWGQLRVTAPESVPLAFLPGPNDCSARIGSTASA